MTDEEWADKVNENERKYAYIFLHSADLVALEMKMRILKLLYK